MTLLNQSLSLEVGMNTTETQKSEDDVILDAFLATAPSTAVAIYRMVRAIALLAIATSLPTTPSWTVALAIAVLSVFNLTKWIAASAVGILLFLTIIPPQYLGFLKG
jgi:hypothetical protein